MPTRGHFAWRRPRLQYYSNVAIYALLLCTGHLAFAAPPDEPNVSQASTHELTPKAIQERLKAVEDAKDLDDAVRARLVETYGKALQQLKLAADAKSRVAAFELQTAQAPEELQRLKSSASAASEPPEPAVPRDLSLADAQQELGRAVARAAELQKRLADSQNEPRLRSDRRAEIVKLQASAAAQLEEVEQQLSLKPATEEPAEEASAAKLLLEARQEAARNELAAFEAELAAYEATTELVAMRRDRAVVQHAQAQQSVKAWENVVNSRRREEAERQAREARVAAARAHPAVKQLAGENSDLVARRQKYAEKIEQSLAESMRLKARTQQLKEQFNKVTLRAGRVGLNETIGLLLRKHRDDLPDVDEHTRNVAERQNETAQLSLVVLELEEQRGELADLDAAAERTMAAIRGSVNELEVPLIADEVQSLLKSKREYLDSLISDAARLQDELQELSAQERALADVSQEFKSFADENILWIRSADLPRLSDLPDVSAAVRWLLSANNWKTVFRALADDVQAHRQLYATCALCCLLLSFGQHVCRRRLRTCGREAAKAFATQFRPTLAALGLTILLAAVWPLVLWLGGTRLEMLAHGPGFVEGVGSTLEGLALLLLTIELPRQVCRSQGLAEAHFGWTTGCVRIIRRSLRWLALLGLPAAAIVLLVETQSNEQWKATLGRLAFVASQLLVAWVTYRIWHAPTGLLQELLAREAEHTWRRFQRFLHAATIGAPAFVALLAVAGYYYTAVRLAWWLLATMWLLLGVVMLHSMLMRWLLLAYRELAIKRARERRAADAAAQAAGDASPVSADATALEPAVSLSDISSQTRRILRLSVIGMMLAGTWLIWKDVLPALNVFRRVQVWPLPFAILESNAIDSSLEGVLTLASLCMAVLILAITFAAARNIPGLLELTLWRRISLDAGVRYAVSAVSKYVITIVGIMAACGRLGLGWSQVQWLAAAISVGLGFGLQEIFANFVSGLILLFERPIRIGDVVSVGDVTGKVTRIRIRATTVRDGDLRELVIPNKDLITGRVMNWTLSGTTARMTIRASTAYGTDPDRVRELLLRVARQHPLVLNDPAPGALLDNFGENAIQFTLWVYTSSLDSFLEVRHDLHTAIAAAFRDAGIEMPRPQRELHIHDWPAPVLAATSARPNGHV